MASMARAVGSPAHSAVACWPTASTPWADQPGSCRTPTRDARRRRSAKGRADALLADANTGRHPPDKRTWAHFDETAPMSLVRRPPRFDKNLQLTTKRAFKASSTSIVMLCDRSIAAIRGCETPIDSASSRCDRPARSRMAVRPAARRSSSSISATGFAAPSARRTFASQSLMVEPRWDRRQDQRGPRS